MRFPLHKRHWVAWDCVVAAGYGLIALFGAYSGLRLSPSGLVAVLAEPRWGGIAVTSLAIALRRRYPVPAAAALLIAATTAPPVWLSLFSWSYVLYTVAATCRLPIALAALGAALTAMVLSYHDMSAPLAVAVVWTVGYTVGRHRAHEQRARQAEVTEERLRIARELHDVVAHSISVITVQAGYGNVVLEKQPEQARDALAAIEATGRETLTEMRRLLGVLRDGDGPARTPAPGLAGLDRLLDQVGVDVEVVTTGTPRPLTPGVDLAAYRIVQEALTNVVRHAGTSKCRLRIHYGDDDVRVEITDHGRGGPPGTGHGIAGMRERAELYGGEFSANPLPEGGFQVTARLVESA
ncbi:sensor histidine kinase [Actinocrispum wychmicini]|uniref:histidine kinase n=1 Tax=Actinocrispum wychmicini TaxID=1213861 RepID=A0A4R2IKV4_9PSEU|nr:sensor histidine kinase [Actinocrispum wychmicini]TCO45287.1 signal transduction histidine kinase [Actinocrispum wychmicini]